MKPAPLIATAALGAVLASPFQDLLGSPGLEVDVVSIPLAQMRQHQQVVHQGAHPRDFVAIEEGTPFTVPDGKLLVIRQLGVASGSGNYSYAVQIHVDGAWKITASQNWVHQGRPFEPGYVVQPGSVVEVIHPEGHKGMALGYLVDA